MKAERILPRSTKAHYLPIGGCLDQRTLRPVIERYGGILDARGSVGS